MITPDHITTIVNSVLASDLTGGEKHDLSLRLSETLADETAFYLLINLYQFQCTKDPEAAKRKILDLAQAMNDGGHLSITAIIRLRGIMDGDRLCGEGNISRFASTLLRRVTSIAEFEGFEKVETTVIGELRDAIKLCREKTDAVIALVKYDVEKTVRQLVSTYSSIGELAQ